MATPDGLIEARRAVLRAWRDAEAWDTLWLQTRAWAPNAPAVATARRDARNALDGLLTALADAQADVEADVEAERVRTANADGEDADP